MEKTSVPALVSTSFLRLTLVSNFSMSSRASSISDLFTVNVVAACRDVRKPSFHSEFTSFMTLSLEVLFCPPAFEAGAEEGRSDLDLLQWFDWE